MANDRWKFYDFPKKLPLDSYKTSIHEFVEIAKKLKNVEAVYRAGSISVPGISDIDLFVIFKNSTSKIDTINFNKLSALSRQLVGHEIGYMEREVFEKFDLFLWVHEPLELLYGNHIEYINMNGIEDRLLIKSLMVFEWLIHKSLHIQRCVYDKNIPVRSLLNKLWSFTYTIKIIEEISNERIGEGYIKDIKQLRMNWFKLEDSNRKNELLRIMHSEIDLSFLIVQKLADTLNNNPDWMTNFEINDIKHSKYLRRLSNKNILYKSPSFIILFTENNVLNTKSKMHDIYATSYSKFKIPFLILPITLSALLMYHVGEEGGLSQKIKRGLSISGDFDTKVIKSETAYERARILNNYYFWIKHNPIIWHLNTYGHPRNSFHSIMGTILGRFSASQTLSKISHLSLSASSND